MKSIGVIVLAVVAFTSFTGIICNPVDTEIEANCDLYKPIPNVGLACNKMLKPVCGTNGQTYTNECELCSHKLKFKREIKIKYRKNCIDKDKQPQDDCQGFREMCTMAYKPICGSDAVTYSNKCAFCGAKKRKADLLIVSDGECERKNDCQGSTEMCTREYKPICGSDAVTYSNKCTFCNSKKVKADLLMDFEGECKQKDECEGSGNMCLDIYKPVCGSDAVTYGNKCSFCIAKRKKAGLTLVSVGACKKQSY